jgi:hypothetical protein
MFESISAQAGPNWKLRLVLAVSTVALGAGFVSLWRMTQMPLKSFNGSLPPLSAVQSELASRLSEDVRGLSTIGERNIHRAGSLETTKGYLRNSLIQAGYTVSEQTYTVEGHPVNNLEAELVGRESGEGAVVVGAHYDSVAGTVGADDNASGVAAILELARMLHESKLRRTIRFVLFVNEEPPYFQTVRMGSYVYAGQLRHDGIPVSAMISLEMLGFYSEAASSRNTRLCLAFSTRAVAISSASSATANRDSWCKELPVGSASLQGFRPKALPHRRTGPASDGLINGRFGNTDIRPL